MGIKKIIIPSPIPGPGGKENSKHAKNGGKMGIFNEKSKFVVYSIIFYPSNYLKNCCLTLYEAFHTKFLISGYFRGVKLDFSSNQGVK